VWLINARGLDPLLDSCTTTTFLYNSQSLALPARNTAHTQFSRARHSSSAASWTTGYPFTIQLAAGTRLCCVILDISRTSCMSASLLFPPPFLFSSVFCISRTIPPSLELFGLFIFDFSYLGRYGCIAKKTPVSKIPVFVALLYRRYILQQAGYQRSSVLAAAETLPQRHAFRHTSQCYE
jgi:hypothetical protein